jgi:hypothetical protein
MCLFASSFRQVSEEPFVKFRLHNVIVALDVHTSSNLAVMQKSALLARLLEMFVNAGMLNADAIKKKMYHHERKLGSLKE